MHLLLHVSRSDASNALPEYKNFLLGNYSLIFAFWGEKRGERKSSWAVFSAETIDQRAELSFQGRKKAPLRKSKEKKKNFLAGYIYTFVVSHVF